jgi:hypothetical protein
MTTDQPPTISKALSEVLAAQRSHLNARTAEVRHRYPAFDTAAFTAFLRTGLDSIASCVAEVVPERTTVAVLTAFDIALELVAQELAGPSARNNLIERAWVSVAPRYARLIADDPANALGLLSNAVLHISTIQGARVEEWLMGMLTMAEHVNSISGLRSVGQVMAWRAGLAHFREGALQNLDALPEATAVKAVGANELQTWPEIRHQFLADCWWSPDNKRQKISQVGIEVGQFTGFGGTFAQPPEVRAVQNGFLVKSFKRYSLLIADVYGSLLLPATSEEFASAGKSSYSAAKAVGSTVVIGERRIELDLPADGLMIVENQHTIVVTSAYSHSIRLFPRQ